LALANGHATCPFCSSLTFKVNYDSSIIASSPLQSENNKNTPVEEIEAAKDPYIIRASIADRKQLERDMQTQRSNSSTDPYFSHPAPSPSTTATNTPSSSR
jgi:hypothetical protein